MTLILSLSLSVIAHNPHQSEYNQQTPTNVPLLNNDQDGDVNHGELDDMERWLDEQEELDEKHERKIQRLEKRAAHKGIADEVCTTGCLSLCTMILPKYHEMFLPSPSPSPSVTVKHYRTHLLTHPLMHTFTTMFN